MWVSFSIEGNGGAGSRWDRAVVRVINTIDGAKTLIVPTGVAYNTTGADPALCDGIGSSSGWSGDRLTWSQASFDLGAFAGIPIQIEVRFSTDSSTLGTQGTAQGFWFDQVEVTNATSIACDSQTNVCAPLPAEVSALTIGRSGGADDLHFSEAAGATSYNVYMGTLESLLSGAYDHPAAGSVCAVIDAAPGDGSVSAGVALPVDSYVLVVGANGSGESVYGQSSAGPIPSTLDSCP
jgi:hypothetical protein